MNEYNKSDSERMKSYVNSGPSLDPVGCLDRRLVNPAKQNPPLLSTIVEGLRSIVFPIVIPQARSVLKTHIRGVCISLNVITSNCVNVMLSFIQTHFQHMLHRWANCRGVSPSLDPLGIHRVEIRALPHPCAMVWVQGVLSLGPMHKIPTPEHQGHAAPLSHVPNKHSPSPVCQPPGSGWVPKWARINFVFWGRGYYWIPRYQVPFLKIWVRQVLREGQILDLLALWVDPGEEYCWFVSRKDCGWAWPTSVVIGWYLWANCNWLRSPIY